MRNAFAAEMERLAAENEAIVLLSGDIGNRLFDRYKEKFPRRFFNCGVAEANMTGMAAGMALCGLRPITYTITPFNTTRCLEQIKIDVCYQNLPVIIVGVGAGLSYAGLGATHHAFEDIALLRVLPNISIVCPADAVEVRLALRAAAAHTGPVYIRLGKKNEPVLHETDPPFAIGRGIVLRQGRDLCLMAAGNIMPEVLGAAEILGRRGLSSQVIDMHTVKPLDSDLLTEVFDTFQLVVSVEEHSRIGGFGAAVAEWWVDHGRAGPRFRRIGLADTFLHGLGNQENARSVTGLSASAIAQRVLGEFQGLDGSRHGK